MHVPDARRLYIDGGWADAADGATFDVHDPATGELLCEVASAGPADAVRAMDAAAAAFPAWAALSGAERGAVLLRVRDLVAERLDAIAAVMTQEQGKPLAEARGELSGCLEFVEWYAEEAKRVYGQVVSGVTTAKRQFVLHRPAGPVVAITPWNFPALMILRKAAAALAAGCPVVVKPAEQTPLTALAIFEALHEAGFPVGVVNLVTTDAPVAVGRALLEHPDLAHLTFTGSTEVGEHLAAEAAKRMVRFSMELGGHAPFIVFADADLEAAVADLTMIKFRNAGQTCVNPNRVFVHADVHDEFVERFTAAATGLRVGSGLEATSDMGPLIDEDAIAKVGAHLDDAVSKGAKVRLGGERVAGPGTFFAPTIVESVTTAMTIAHEETFGPVAPVIRFDDGDDVWALANATRYGLVAYVYTRDLELAFAAAERLDFGVVGVNDPRPGSAQTPFGGVKESGAGREGGREGLYEFLETHTLSIGVSR
jgi:succinate-semialdehyde dehydrogenase / glutarate-semialdehyde dehydrogenase